MFSRLRALNEDDSNSDSDEDGNKRPSKEVQEEQAISLYNKTLLLMAGSQIEEAITALESLLACPYLIEEEKTSSPIQNQIRLGCLKNLSTLYCREPFKNLEAAKTVLLKATEMNPENVNLWKRLGQVSLTAMDYQLSHAAFIEALRCSPNHWECIENLVTLSYVINDPKGCLRFCALGLEKDTGFLKGLVFRDHVFKIYPALREFSKTIVPNYDSLMVNTKYEDKWRDRYLDEASKLTKLQCETYTLLKSIDEEKYSTTMICPYPFKIFNLVELCTIVLEMHSQCKLQGTFCRPVNLTGSTSEEKLQKIFVSESKEDTCETADENNSSIRRSSTLNEEKEIVITESFDETNEASATGEEEDYLNGSQSQMEQTDADGMPKKKSRKDVKWWQLEGKRRSQRVRGHLLPTVPNKPKSENGFSELLRNIIPPSLLTEEEDIKEREDSKASDGKTNLDDGQPYFGSEAEVLDVKNILEELGTADILTIVLYLTKYLASNCKRRWPQELASEFLKLYTIYMSHTQRPDVNSVAEDNLEELQSYCFIVLAMLELCTEELTTNGLELLKAEASLSAELNYLYEILTNKVLINKEMMLRLKWLQLKYSLAVCQGEENRSRPIEYDGDSDCSSVQNSAPANYQPRPGCKYEDVLVYLNLLRKCLSESPELQIFLHTKNDSVISLHEIEKKLNAVNRMRSLNKINELYEAEKYSEVIEILNFCLQSDEASSACDAKNRYYLAESYFHVGDLECVVHCVKAIKFCIRRRNEEELDDCITLLERICIAMNNSLTFREERLIANSIIQILLFNEKRSNSKGNLIDTPWCILHRILYHVETEEPLLYLEEESIPNSILVLQMAHEVLSRSGKCAVNNGKLLVYTIDAILSAKRATEHYWMFEETKHVIEQAIFCLYSHPSKKSKLRYLSEHNITGINPDSDMCLKLYEYYKPVQLPEFDSYDFINSEVEILFKRILAIIPEELKPIKQVELVKQFIDESGDLLPEITTNFPDEYRDIYYLLADHNFKGKEWIQAVANYVLDVTINPSRFDSWASLALCKSEIIVTRLNSCDDITLEDLVFHSKNVLKCFLKSLDLEPTNMKIRIEFGSFAYAMHALCSRFMKFQGTTLTFEKYIWLEDNRISFLTYTLRCFDPELKEFSTASKPVRASGNPDEQHDEIWMQHYMMGKVMEKGNPVDPSNFLKHYILAAELLHKQGAQYPAKINFYNPQELAIEALEIFYRVHASILKFAERVEYKSDIEKSLLHYLNIASQSPFMKSKLSRSDTSDSKKRKQSVSDDATTKKDVMETLNELLTKVENLVDSPGVTALVSRSNSQSIDDSSSSNIATSKTDNILELGLVTSAELANKQEEAAKLTAANVFDTDAVGDFSSTPWGNVVSKCVKAMQECIARFSQHHKAYFRLAKALKCFKKDSKAAKEVFIGSAAQKKKLCGLFGDRKANNFFNGVWRNPIDDIDRPGSFPFHMKKSVQLLLDILIELNDYQLLADIGIQLTKVPDSDKKYLMTEDRETYSQKAFTGCGEAAKSLLTTSSVDVPDILLSIYDTYLKVNRYNQKDKDNVLTDALHEAYIHYNIHYNQCLPVGKVPIELICNFCLALTWTHRPKPIPGRMLPMPNDGGQIPDGINLSENEQSGAMSGGVQKKLGRSKRIQGRSLTPGGSEIGDAGQMGVMDENMMPNKVKRPLPQQNTYPRQFPDADQTKDVVCLDLTQEPANVLVPLPPVSTVHNFVKLEINSQPVKNLGLPKPMVSTPSLESSKASINSSAVSIAPGPLDNQFSYNSPIPSTYPSLKTNPRSSTSPLLSPYDTQAQKPQPSQNRMPLLHRQDATSQGTALKLSLGLPFTPNFLKSTSGLTNSSKSSKYSNGSQTSVAMSLPSTALVNTSGLSKLSAALPNSTMASKFPTGLMNSTSSSKFSTGLPNNSTSGGKYSPMIANNTSKYSSPLTNSTTAPVYNRSSYGTTSGKEYSTTTTTYSSPSSKLSSKTQVARKSTGCSVAPVRSRSPNLSQNSMSYSSALNTSPYKQQSNAMSTPNLNFGLGSDLKIARSDRLMINKLPPAAHSLRIRRLTFTSSNSPEPEIIDLTVKSPTKSETQLPQRKKPISNPVSIKREELDTSLRLSGNDEGTVSAYIPVNTMPSSSHTKVKIVPLMIDKTPVKHMDTGTKPGKRPQVPVVKPSTSATVISDAKKSYPLPPKKKKMLMASNTPSPPPPNITVRTIIESDNPSDFEVITLD